MTAALTIWIIGWLYTLERDEVTPGARVNNPTVLLFIWPLRLGYLHRKERK